MWANRKNPHTVDRRQSIVAAASPQFIAAATHAVGGSLVPVPGGVLVRGTDRAIIGAVGISGDNSDNDEAAAIAGIGAAGLTADPGEG